MSKTIRVSNGDWESDERGRFTYIEDREKCAQDTACSLLQKLYANGLWGSELHRVEQGTVVDTVSAHKVLVETMVGEAVERLMAFQEQDDDISDLEKIRDFETTVARSASAALSYDYYLAVHTEGSNEPVTQAYTVEIEQVRDPNREVT